MKNNVKKSIKILHLGINILYIGKGNILNNFKINQCQK